MNIPELLAPVGNFETLQAAVQAGADAVYFGGRRFNARSSADNFGLEDLEKAIDYAHLHKVKVYITLNTIFFDSETEELVKFIEWIYEKGADSVIVQDMGIVKIIKELFPDLSIHASTQMSVVNEEAVKVLQGLGIKRVVVGRELSIAEINAIKNNSSIEIETFVHGALCVCYSGKCLMSSMIGGRSGNRGRCAQPCRLKYSIKDMDTLTVTDSEYIMSTKDICTLHILPELIKSGTNSLKIEGRMKGAEYVYIVTSIYRKYLDLLKTDDKNYSVDQNDYDMLLSAFNRGGFSTGYLKGKSCKELVTFSKPKNWGLKIGEVIAVDKNGLRIKLSKPLNRLDGIEVWKNSSKSIGKIVDSIYDTKNDKVEELRENSIAYVKFEDTTDIERGFEVYKTYSKKIEENWKQASNQDKKNIPICIELILSIGKKAILKIKHGAINVIKESNDSIEKAIKVATTEEKIKSSLLKLGDTPFYAENICIEMDEGINVPIKVINELRRSATEALRDEIVKSYKRDKNKNSDNIKNNAISSIRQIFEGVDGIKQEFLYRISVDVYNFEQFLGVVSVGLVDRINYDVDAYIRDSEVHNIAKICKEKNIELILKISYVFKQEKLSLMFKYANRANEVDGAIFADIGLLNLVKTKKIGDYALNVSNSLSALQYKQMGFDEITYSVETKLEDMESINKFNILEHNVLVHGYVRTMISEHCPISVINTEDIQENYCGGICKGKNYLLVDRMGKEHRLITNNLCQSIVFNPDIMYNADRLSEFKKFKIKSIRIDSIFIDSQELIKVISEYIDGFKLDKGNIVKNLESYTRGNYYRGVE